MTAVPPLRPWLFDLVLPFWAETGLDRAGGGFFERLGPDRTPDTEADKRLRVQARQIYVFSHAHVLGAPAWALAAARHGCDFLVGRGWDGGAGGWVHTLARDGTPRDRMRDTYDAAFVLLALAWFHRATGERAPLDWARRTIEFLDRRLADPAQGGYFEHVAADGQVPREGRRQNPHMHLFEALLALHAATGEAEWADRAVALLDLFRKRFLDPETGTLIEHFTADWRPAPGPAGRVREPGHHFEWVWLLAEAERRLGAAGLKEPADRLWRFALDHGIDRAAGQVPAVFDAVDREGRPLQDGKRLWPQTEAVKAMLARHETFGDAGAADLARAHLAMMFAAYVEAGSPVWRDQLDREGRDIARYIPASTLYHLFVCIVEALRVLGDGGEG